MRKVFLDNLPKYKGFGVDWKRCMKECIEIDFIYDDIIGKIKVVDYDKESRDIFIKYKDNEPFRINSGAFRKCALGNMLGIYSDKFKFEIGQTFKDDKRDITIMDRKYKNRTRSNGRIERQKYYKYKCNKCGFDCGEHYRNQEYQEEMWIEESNLLNGKGCSCCCDSPQIVVESINSIVITNPYMIKFFQGGYDEAKLYTKRSNKKIFPVCPDCKKVREKEMKISDIYKYESIGCKYCGDGYSYPNKFMFNMLEQSNIDFKAEYSPKWIGRKFYDFYFKLNNNKYIVEMDGGFHKKYNNMNGQTARESKEIDNYKDRLAKEHNIEVIRIDSEFSNLEYIKDNILNSRLSELFDLSIINWNKIEEYSMSNRVKEACEYKKNNPNITTTQIGKIMKLDKNTISKYLKQGNELEWCEYNTKERYVPIEVFKDNISLGIFESGAEISQKSEELFGVKMDNSNICTVCSGRLKSHKGFTFKYVDKSNEYKINKESA